MTREEFITAYCDRSKIPMEARRIDGFDLGSGYMRIALPCACGEEDCEGWAMINPKNAEDHMRFYAPRAKA